MLCILCFIILSFAEMKEAANGLAKLIVMVSDVLMNYHTYTGACYSQGVSESKQINYIYFSYILRHMSFIRISRAFQNTTIHIIYHSNSSIIGISIPGFQVTNIPYYVLMLTMYKQLYLREYSQNTHFLKIMHMHIEIYIPLNVDYISLFPINYFLNNTIE